ncbi:MAG: EamA family transporter [Solirubrobacterales bacterium]
MGSPSASPQAPAAALVVASILSVQLGSAAATTIFDQAGAAGANLLRTAFAALLVAAVWRPAMELLRGSKGREVIAFGMVLAGMNTFFFLALDRLPLGIAVAFEFIGPLGVAVAASRSRLDLLWVTLAGAAILLLAPDIGNGLDGLGVAYALAAAACWAGYILLSARIGRTGAGQHALALALMIATLPLVPIGIVDGGSELLDPGVLAIGLGIAALSSAIPFSLEMEALKRLPEGVFGVLLSLEPAIAAGVGLVALGQSLAAVELVAIGLIIIASAGALRAAPTVEAVEA